MAWSFAESWQRVEGEVLGLNESEVAALRPFLVFGEYAFDGGASPLVALHESDWTIHGIDVELSGDPVFWFNSSLAAFIETFRLLDSVLQDPGPSVPSGLRNDVELLDPAGFERSDWAGLIDALIG